MSADHRDVLIDAHVHYHCGFSRRAFFDAARRNLDAGARQLGLGEGHASVLMLTESAGVDAFGRFAAEAARGVGPGAEPSTHAGDADPEASRSAAGAGAWSFRQTGEGNSLWAVAGSPDATAADTASGAGAPSAEILLVAGRQIVTRDRLEVLGLGCRAGVADGLPLRAARDAVIEAGGVPVVPWGFGKWWLSRGRRVSRLLREDSPGRWFLGDNAGRPGLSRRPALFRSGAQHGVFVLPGSDPLPLPGQEAKVGRCGLLMPGPLDRERPADALLAWLRRCAEQPRTFGRYEDLARFTRDQIAMQLRRRGRDAVSAAGTANRNTRPSTPAARGDAP